MSSSKESGQLPWLKKMAMDGNSEMTGKDIKKVFDAEGYCVVPGLLSPQQIGLARQLSQSLINRHRAGEEAMTRKAVSVASVTSQHPDRNPGVEAGHWEAEPFIIGDLIAHDERFSEIIASLPIWKCACLLLECDLPDVIFHLSNLTLKPAGVGPAIGWHRDAGNTYFSTVDGRTIRFLLPLHAMSERNGGTALIPGSHRSSREYSSSGETFPSVPPGSGLVLHSQVLHGGYPNRSVENRDVVVLQFGVRSSELIHKGNEHFSLCDYEDMKSFRTSQREIGFSFGRE
ncbi:phytanoyl-CoA dioxygenase family protein [Alloalcanivorax dieselolei]|uniref:phytanoyl-CoA dioxygenase family protein n=1 Tax=Alloalcanivorax dieselolei TaxID=285091 RepID=UPI0009D99B62|nr:phytanoyl-CoA dioxygenase family protein [Alloalcanivorax dieselolei]